MYCTISRLYCTIINSILYYTSSILYCTSSILFCTIINSILYFTISILYCTSSILYCTGSILYCAIINRSVWELSIKLRASERTVKKEKKERKLKTKRGAFHRIWIFSSPTTYLFFIKPSRLVSVNSINSCENEFIQLLIYSDFYP